ncbi:MAG: putative toxin-antitoxin system toxin component, PIN family [Polynucleobacter sp.]|nr:putative toxin-antitoxin system toxin component, PIN family [Polynucleobacter sp.]
MKPRLVLDTNVILDLLVFKDPTAEPIRQLLDAKLVDAVRSKASMLELIDVIQRPMFKLSQEEQEFILQAWESVTRLLENTTIEPAPFACRDLDDQVFLDMAYSVRPALLLSKDLRVLELQGIAQRHSVEISRDYERVRHFSTQSTEGIQ